MEGGVVSLSADIDPQMAVCCCLPFREMAKGGSLSFIKL